MTSFPGFHPDIHPQQPGCPCAHVPGFSCTRQTVPPAGTCPELHVWCNQSRGFGTVWVV